MKADAHQKFFSVILAIYWSSILIATHIPIPGWTRRMGVSDKTMHFIAYLILSLLLWLGTSFGQKANWRKLRPWLLTGILIFYALADELSQHFIRRSSDIKDFAANMAGIATAMVAVSILPVHYVVIMLLTVSPLFLPALVRSQLIAQGSITEIYIYFLAFVAVTAGWVKYIPPISAKSGQKTLSISLIGPIVILGIVKIYAVLTSKPLGIASALSAIAAIIVIIAFWQLIIQKRNLTLIL